MADQERFAESSGDTNPIHVDLVAARRLLFGEPIVHGMNAAIWALEVFESRPAHLKVRFCKPIFLGEKVTASLKSEGCIEVRSARGLLINIKTDGTGLYSIKTMMDLSRLVGMDCPGLHSLLSFVDVKFSSEEEINYNIKTVHERYSLMEINVSGSVEGTVKAFMPPAPVVQPDMTAVAAAVSTTAFKDQCALIVGGSRGLGEVTAKIIAAGGGDVIITYHTGVRDAERVVVEITKWGGRCDLFQLDVTKSVKLDLEKPPTHLYYFATPRILKHSDVLFDTQLFQKFCAIYIDGFIKVYDECRKIADNKLRVFYPSSVAVDGILENLPEYAAAKAAGEMLCREVKGVTRRLPRMNTDQTAAIPVVPGADTLELMLEICTDCAS